MTRRTIETIVRCLEGFGGSGGTLPLLALALWIRILLPGLDPAAADG